MREAWSVPIADLMRRTWHVIGGSGYSPLVRDVSEGRARRAFMRTIAITGVVDGQGELSSAH